MVLNLNDQSVRLPYQEFYGAIREQMPLLIADGRTPLSVAGLMERRLNPTQTTEWRDNYFDTGDGFAYKGDTFKVVADAQPLRELTGRTHLTRGAVVLADGAYEKLEGPEFSRKKLGEMLGRDLSADEAKQHPVWLALARDDKALLETYVGTMFEDMKKRFGYDTAMGVYLDEKSNTPQLRAWYVDGLGDYGSQAFGTYLDAANGRLVGVAPEALSAPGKVIVQPSLEQALAVVNQHMGDALTLRRR